MPLGFGGRRGRTKQKPLDHSESPRSARSSARKQEKAADAAASTIRVVRGFSSSRDQAPTDVIAMKGVTGILQENADTTSTVAGLKESFGTGCLVCKKEDNEDRILLCELCEGEYHTYCLHPALAAIPEGDWFCGTLIRERRVVLRLHCQVLVAQAFAAASFSLLLSYAEQYL